MLTWADLTRNWAASFAKAKTRFPNLRDRDMPFLKLDRDRFVAYLAETHQLSLDDARAQFAAFLKSEATRKALAGSDQRRNP